MIFRGDDDGPGSNRCGGPHNAGQSCNGLTGAAALIAVVFGIVARRGSLATPALVGGARQLSRFLERPASNIPELANPAARRRDLEAGTFAATVSIRAYDVLLLAPCENTLEAIYFSVRP